MAGGKGSLQGQGNAEGGAQPSLCLLYTSIRIHTDFKQIHRYAAAMVLIQAWGLPAWDYGLNDRLWDELGMVMLQPELVKGRAENLRDVPGVLVVDQVEDSMVDFLQSRDEGEPVIFLNTQEDYRYFDGKNYKVFENIRPLVLQKMQDGVSKEKEEYIWIYAKGGNKKVAENISWERHLKYKMCIRDRDCKNRQ